MPPIRTNDPITPTCAPEGRACHLTDVDPPAHDAFDPKLSSAAKVHHGRPSVVAEMRTNQVHDIVIRVLSCAAGTGSEKTVSRR